MGAAMAGDIVLSQCLDFDLVSLILNINIKESMISLYSTHFDAFKPER